MIYIVLAKGIGDNEHAQEPVEPAHKTVAGAVAHVKELTDEGLEATYEQFKLAQ